MSDISTEQSLAAVAERIIAEIHAAKAQESKDIKDLGARLEALEGRMTAFEHALKTEAAVRAEREKHVSAEGLDERLKSLEKWRTDEQSARATVHKVWGLFATTLGILAAYLGLRG